MDRVLVTGGAGFIGSCFVQYLLGRDSARQILVLDKLTYAGHLCSLRSVASHPSFEFVKGDIADRPLLNDLFTRFAPSAVIHFAVESHVDRSIDAPLDFVMTNVVGTAQLLEATRGYWDSLPPNRQSTFRFLHCSTDEVFGSLNSNGLFTEQSVYAPNSPYSASKAASDHFVRAYCQTYGLPVLTTHCANNFGPFQYPEKLIPLMILNAIDERSLPIYGDGQHIRDWLYVWDHCTALESVLFRGRAGESYNIGSQNERSNLEVVHAVCDALESLAPELFHRPLKDLIVHVEDRPGHDRRYGIDATKIRSELGWEPAFSFETALRETVAWYLQNRDWVEEVTRGNFDRQRLGVPIRNQTGTPKSTW
ncbi:MAG: dTDP-glucose 4,6-dehydratase [Planctomycetales bacterium]|nr:dTDP-glucose 4,6-dehydratase [Planctomycetales bacterium]MCB0685774.1 dTDP-glucose 4,6-dehydratase [Saprospiraceae bacterium]